MDLIIKFSLSYYQDVLSNDNYTVFMIRKYIFLFALLLSGLNVSGQIYDPVEWDFDYKSKGEGIFELIFTATIEEGSHIYSMDVPEGGPIPTSFAFDTLPSFTFEGKPYEVTQPEELFDEAFGFKIKSFSKKAEFRQRIKAANSLFTVSGTVNFMSCSNMSCSPPKDVEFSILIGDRTISANTSSSDESLLLSGPSDSKSGLLKFFLLSMLAGLAGILTPCVFPMIPMTVAFFSRDSENRGSPVLKAFIFGISIMLIYSLLGIIVSITSAGAGFAAALSTHWLPNLLFFCLFIFFAISFLGAFEIVLPNRWVTGADSRVDKGGIVAAFFLGLTTVIVSFSCTGPIIGVLLVEAASGDIFKPTVGMFGFGLAFSLPFTIFALSPALMSKMPKSGGWLNEIKVVLGFLMLAFSLRFLLIIDSVYTLRILSRDIYLSIWIVLFTTLGFYLSGKIRFRHDSNLSHIGIFRFFLIIAVFSFVVYLIPGLFGSPLKGLSALLPSYDTSELNMKVLTPGNNPTSLETFKSVDADYYCSEPLYHDIFEMPLGLTGYFDYYQGLACAKVFGKPVFLDFKGHACANCKRMEAKVWSDPEVLKSLKEDFVIVALYVDDRTLLPEDKWIISEVDGKWKKTIGKINEDLEISKFKTNALPLYVITDHEGNPVNQPMTTNLNAGEFKQWLDEGIMIFTSKNH